MTRQGIACGALSAVRWLRLLVVSTLFGQAGLVLADTLVLNVKASNPGDQRRMVTIKAFLPAGLRTNNIIGLDGLTPGYDVKSGLYYVGDAVPMAPGESRTFAIVLEDIWTIPSSGIDQLRAHAESLTFQLKGTEYESRGRTLEHAVTEQLLDVAARQAQNKAGSVDAEKHIAVFHQLSDALSIVRNNLFELENMVLGTGQDPGALVGEAPERRQHMRPDAGNQDYRKVTFAIMVTNPSPTESHSATVMSWLPPEVTAADVIDAAGLTVGVDPESGCCYVRKGPIALAPGAAAAFSVVMRDKWNVNGPRIASLKSDASNLLAKVRSWGRYKAVEDQLQGSVDELDCLAHVAAPQVVGDAYVAFYRDQAAVVDRVGRTLDRLMQAPYRTSVLGPSTPPPTRNTTWGIIFAIIGFLALVTLVVVFGSLRGRHMP